MKDYLDPKQNPFIQTGDDDGNPRPAYEEVPLSESIEQPIDLPGPDGKWPWETKAEPAEENPEVEPEPQRGGAGYEAKALEGINDGSLRKLMGADENLYIYDNAFYDPDTPSEKKFFMKPVIELVKRGPEVAVNRLDGGTNILTAYEAGLIRAAMKRKAG
jgi:hypothetical protein